MRESRNRPLRKERRADNGVTTSNVKSILKGERKNFNNYSKIQGFLFNYFYTRVFFFCSSVRRPYRYANGFTRMCFTNFNKTPFKHERFFRQ